MDDFEQLLKNQPMRVAPPEWRAEILAAADESWRRKKAVPAWQAWLWPSPYAWGALTAAWLVIIGLNLASQTKESRDMARWPAPTQQEIFAMLDERRRLMEEFQPKASVRSEPLPSPKPDSPGAWLDRREPRSGRLV